ncbi:hypothetical protein C2G38_2182352 [Gigaspora rosea]|uniref:Uncharacterized protein n=1 Tax=Gigaspora rosea TaxID=44941 RepID=A0A397VE79_9GLOM|nr:hypothetical protein C2G38_2182352 [Gigaspora rosea]
MDKWAYITDAKKECLIPTLLPVRRCNTSNIDIVSILDQDDINELTSHTQGSDSSIPIINIPKKKHINIESIFDQDDKNKIINRAQDSDTSINISNEDKAFVLLCKMSQKMKFSCSNKNQPISKDTLTLMKLLLKKNRQPSAKRHMNSTQNFSTSNNMSPMKSSLKTNLRSSAQKHTGIVNTPKQSDTTKNNTQNSSPAKPLLKRNLQFSAQKHIDIENMTRQDNIIESNTQESSTSNNMGEITSKQILVIFFSLPSILFI